MQEQSKPVNGLAYTKLNCKYCTKTQEESVLRRNKSEVREIIRTLCQWKVVEIIE